MATIDDILKQKKTTPGVIQNPDDNPSGSNGGVTRPQINTPETRGVQAPPATPVKVAPGLPTEDLKPLPTTPATPAQKPAAPKPAAPKPAASTPAAPTQKPETTSGTPKPHKPQPSGEPIDESKFKPFEFYDNFHPQDYAETEEEKKARLKKEKREAVLGAIADGLAAFHNAYAHARGTQPMPNVGGNLSKLRQRLDKEKKEREDKGYKIYDMQQRQKQFEANEAWRKSQVEMSNRREDRLDKKLELEREKNNAYRQYQESIANKNNEQAAYWKAKWKALEDGKDLDEALKEAKIASEKALREQRESATNLNNTKANKEENGVGEYTTTTTVQRDERGRETGRTTTRQKGINNGNNTSNGGGKPTQGTTKSNGKKPNPMGNNTNNGKKKNPMN